MTLFVCTAGTSIAGGPIKREENAELYRTRIEAKIQRDRADELSREAFLVRASAETNGLFRAGITDRDEVVFLTTETEDGRLCGTRLVAFVEKEFSCHARTVEVKGLQVRDGVKFRREGIGNFFSKLDEVTADRDPEEIRLNATGGFKGAIPYLVLYGMFNGLPVSYVYEFSDTLITLPPIPVEFDWARVAPAAQTIIAIAKAGALSESEWRINMPPDYFVHQGSYDTLFEFDRGAVGLSAIGYLMKRRLEEATASAVVHLSPIARHSLEQADPATRREFQMMLDRVRDPTARRQPHHQDSLHTCDLKVWKRYAAQGPRMCYWLERDNVYVAELFSTHS
jgi:putative CRISPR-associated protein (TIGR02619 family)